MAITTRISVFETNSSSSHSIAIKIGEEWDTIIPDEEGIIKLNGGEFGWQWEKFNDSLTKANYCAVSFKYYEDKLESLKEIIKNYTGATDVIFNFSDDYSDYNWAYVDHQSNNILNDYGDEDLSNFIFNKSSWLFLGNDNEYPPLKFHDTGDEKYTHILKIILDSENILTWELKENFSESDLEKIIYSLLSNVRYNVTNEKWDVDYSYCYSGEIYLKFLYDIDFENKKISFGDKFDKNTPIIKVEYELIEK